MASVDVLVFQPPTGAVGWRDAVHRRAVVEVVDAALAVARALTHLHRAGWVHGRLCPATVLLEGRRVRLVGLAGAAPLPPPSPGQRSPYAPYAAPELDAEAHGIGPRADLYALGAMVQEALTGAPPFAADDDASLRHAHRAHPPPPLRGREPLPEVLAGVITRLLQKRPEDRYGSASGLAHDLERIATLLRHLGAVPAFELGRSDADDRLEVPSELLGRRDEEAQLVAAFEQARRGALSVVHLTGPAGIGKTALARTLVAPTLAAGGWLGHGGSAPHSHRGVYLPWSEALDQLVHQILAEPPERLASIEHAVRGALGSQAGLLVQLVPRLAELVGPQAPTASLQGREFKARLSRLVLRLLTALATPSHPVVLVLEDLHWTGRATLDLLCPWLDDPTLGHVLIVLTSRPEACTPAMRAVLDRVEAREQVGSIFLTPLTAETTSAWLGAALEMDPHAVRSLSRPLHAKTQGNPLALQQALVTLRDRGVLRRQDGAWRWQEAEVERFEVPDSVAGILVERIADLPPTTRDLMAVAASLGADARLDLLKRVWDAWHEDRSHDAMMDHLTPAAEGGLVTLHADQKRLSFPHERLREAALSYHAPSERQRIHETVGRILLDAQPDPTTLSIPHHLAWVEHLNRAPSLVSGTERAAFNLAAARRAQGALAFENALQLARAGLDALGPDGWSTVYALALDLHTLTASLAFHHGDDALRVRCSEAVLVHAATALERVPIHLLTIRDDLAQGQWDRATDIALMTLRSLGVRLPERPGKPHVAAELARTWAATRGRPITAHADLPTTSEPLDLAIDELLVWCATAGYFAAPDLVPVCGLRMTALAARRGVGPHSAFGFALMGMVHAGVLERTVDAMAWADAAEALMQRFDGSQLVGKVGLLVDGFTRGWGQPLRRHIPRLLDHRSGALDVGDVTFAVYCGAAAFYNAFATGWSLDLIEERFAPIVEHARRSGQNQAWPMFAAWGQLHACLRDPTHRSGLLQGDLWDDPVDRERLLSEGDGNGLGHSATASGQLAYLMGDTTTALASLRFAHRRIEAILSQLVIPTHRAFLALSLLGEADRLGGPAAWRLRREAAFHVWRLRRWAERNPDEWSGLLGIVEGEQLASEGRLVEALARWQRAVHDARRARREAEVALAQERAGTWAARSGLGQIGRALLIEAREGWQRVHALAKVHQLTEAYALPALASREGSEARPLLRTVRSLASEIEPERVLKVLLDQVLEASKGQLVVLLLQREHGLEVVAEHEVLHGRQRLLVTDPLADRPDLPAPLFHYAQRTLRTLHLPDASAHELYPRCPGLADRQVVSLLCVPLRAHGQARGVLYVEHRVVGDAIEPHQLEILEALCAQAAISLENANLYANAEAALQQARADRQQLQTALRRIRVSSVSIQRLGSILEGISDAVLVFDAEQQLSYANTAARHLLDPSTMHALLEELDTSLHDCWLDTLKGRVRVRIAVGELLDADGAPRGTVLSIADVSERHRTEEALRAARAAAEAANRSKSAFLANMSHELRTPLNAIIGYADLLEEECIDAEPDELRTDLARIRSSGEHLLQLINDILDLSKIEADRMDVLVDDHPVATLWDRIADPARILAAENGNKLIVQLDDVPDEVRCDGLRATQILLNLLSNASKFTSEGRIEVGYTVGDDQLGLWVRDSGIGMTQAQVARIFDAFQQAEATTSHTYGGTGLGLTLSRKLARLMGGELDVTTHPGEGSTFTLWLPRSSVATEPLPAARPLERTPDASRRRGPQTTEPTRDLV